MLKDKKNKLFFNLLRSVSKYIIIKRKFYEQSFDFESLEAEFQTFLKD